MTICAPSQQQRRVFTVVVLICGLVLTLALLLMGRFRGRLASCHGGCFRRCHGRCPLICPRDQRPEQGRQLEGWGVQDQHTLLAGRNEEHLQPLVLIPVSDMRQSIAQLPLACTKSGQVNVPARHCNIPLQIPFIQWVGYPGLKPGINAQYKTVLKQVYNSIYIYIYYMYLLCSAMPEFFLLYTSSALVLDTTSRGYLLAGLCDEYVGIIQCMIHYTYIIPMKSSQNPPPLTPPQKKALTGTWH